MSSIKQQLLRMRRVFTYPPFESVLRALVGGSDYRGFAVKLIPPPDLYTPGKRKLVTTSGIRFELDNSCLMQWYVFWQLHDITRDSLYSMVKPGDVVLDVGTNIGETLLNFSRLVGKEGFVYGFEPDPVNHAAVTRNIDLNKAENVRVFNVGVSDKSETVKLFRVDPHNRGMNRILNDGEAASFDDFTEISVDTLDNVVKENGIERIDLIKIDIEGYEMHALRGGIETLRILKPKLFIEVGYTRLLSLGTSPTEMVGFLEDLGYTIYHADTHDRITTNYDFSPLGEGGIDVYAVPNSDE